MIGRRFAVALLAAAPLCAATPSIAVELPLGSKPLEISRYEGYCALDTGNMVDAILWATIKESQVEPYQVIDVQVDCSQLDLLRRNGESGTINPFVTVLMMTDADGRAAVVNLPRRIYLTALESSLSGSGGDKILEDASKAVEDRMSTVMGELAEAGGIEYRTEGIQVLGIVDRDDHAVYVASLQHYTMDGNKVTEISLGGATLLRNHALVVRLQQDYRNPKQIETMLEEVRGMIQSLVAANEDSL